MVVIGAALGLLLGVEVLILHLTTDPLADVHAYYAAGARLNAGQALYAQAADVSFNFYYFYPPLLAIVFRPLALLPFEVAALLWEAVLLGATVLTIRRIGLRLPVVLLVCWLALPLAWALAIGQAQALVTLLLAYGTPFGVALAANLKLFPGLVAVYWVGRREWRRLLRFGGWMAALIVLQIVLEPSGTLAYLGFLTTDLVGNVQNLSLYAISPVLWAASVAVMGLLALRFAQTRWGWPLAVVFSVFATPRLLTYQMSSLLAVFRPPEPADADPGASRVAGQPTPVTHTTP